MINNLDKIYGEFDLNINLFSKSYVEYLKKMNNE